VVERYKKSVRKGQWGNWFDSNVTWNRGSRNKIMFWEDVWTSDFPLKDRIPRLFSNSVLKNATLGEVGFWNENQWIWNLVWIREWFEWDKLLLEELMCQHPISSG